MDGSPCHIYFKNKTFIPEHQLFLQIKEALVDAGVKIGKAFMGPSEDLYNCEWKGKSFSLIYDIDYGPCLYVEDPELRGLLLEQLAQHP